MDENTNLMQDLEALLELHKDFKYEDTMQIDKYH